MKIRLVYEGDLFSNQTGSNHRPSRLTIDQHKQKIRREIHHQLKRAFTELPALKSFSYCPGCKTNHNFGMGDDNTHKTEDLQQCISREIGDRAKVGKFYFCPLVNDKLGLECSLDILIMRHGTRRGVYEAGDLDNRVKTLIDGLTMPNLSQVQDDEPNNDEEPFFTLMSDDNIISGLRVEADLLHKISSGQDGEKNISKVLAIITVEIKPSVPNSMNIAFV
jgi:hypothetical protein